MRLYAFTLAYMDSAIVEASVHQWIKTLGAARPERWLFIPHHWPVNTKEHELKVRELAALVGAEVVNPEKNMGGTGGANFAIHQLNPEPDDLILWLDADSFPVAPGWLDAMVDVMRADQDIATLSLWPPGNQMECGEGAGEEDAVIAGHNVKRFTKRAQMFSVCLWRASFALPKIEAEFEWYGQIEGPAFLKAFNHGMYCGYLPDFKESANPIPHPQAYTDWKNAHARERRFTGNFDTWLAMGGQERNA